MSTVETEESVQKLGVISISYQVGGGYVEGGHDYELTRNISTIVRSVPLRIVAIYVCYTDTLYQRFADLISHMVSPFLRVRLRSIQGMECRKFKGACSPFGGLLFLCFLMPPPSQ